MREWEKFEKILLPENSGEENFPADVRTTVFAAFVYKFL